MLRGWWRDWLEEGRSVRCTAPWWAWCGWLGVTVLTGLVLGALLAGAVAGVMVFFSGE